MNPRAEYLKIPNDGAKTWVIGDIHGCGIELIQLLHEIDARPGVDRILCVGDLFDRGMSPTLVWQALHMYQVKCALGNHEIKFAKIINGTAANIPCHYLWCRKKMNEDGISDENILNFISRQASLYIFDEQEVIVTHGGVSLHTPRIPHESANSYGSFNSNEPMPRDSDKTKVFWWDHYKGTDLVIYGHITTDHCLPRVRVGSIGIDGACCHGGCLIAYCVETGDFHSVPAQTDWFTKLRTQEGYQADCTLALKDGKMLPIGP